MKFDGAYVLPKGFPEELVLRRASLHPLGIPDYAWSRADAIKVCELLGGAGMAILGGDVYEITQDGACPALDNWSCNSTEKEQQSNEAWERFVVRATQAAKQYISSYPEKPARRFVYGIVWTSCKPE